MLKIDAGVANITVTDMEDVCNVAGDGRVRSKMDVVCMIDTNIPNNLHHRESVLKEIDRVCSLANAKVHHETVCALSITI